MIIILRTDEDDAGSRMRERTRTQKKKKNIELTRKTLDYYYYYIVVKYEKYRLDKETWHMISRRTRMVLRANNTQNLK